MTTPFELDPADQAALTDFLDSLATTGLRPDSCRRYALGARNLAKFLAPATLLAATADEVERWAGSFTERGLSKHAADNYVPAVRRMYGWWHSHGLIPTDPAAPRDTAFRLAVTDQAALDDHLRDMRRRGRRPATMRDRRDMARRLAQWLTPTTLLDATRDDVERWADHLVDTGRAPATRAAYAANIRSLYHWWARRGVIDSNPAEDLIPPRVPLGQPRPIPEDALQRALDAADQPLRAWLVLDAYAGLRSGEIGRLRREDVLDTERPALLRVVDGKGGRHRMVPLADSVVAELRPHLNGVRRGRLWLPNRANPAVAVTNTITVHMRDLGLPYTCHSLRHRFGTRTYQLSRDLRMVQGLLGHANPTVTAVYAAWDTSASGAIVGQLAEGLQTRKAVG